MRLHAFLISAPEGGYVSFNESVKRSGVVQPRKTTMDCSISVGSAHLMLQTQPRAGMTPDFLTLSSMILKRVAAVSWPSRHGSRRS